MLRHRGISMCLVTAILATAGTAEASSVKVTATYTGDSPTEIVQINSTSLPPQYNGYQFYAGASNFTDVKVEDVPTGDVIDNQTGLSASDVSGILGSSFQGFCIDLHHLISAPTTSFWDVGNLDQVTASVNNVGIADPTAVEYLWGTHAANPFTNASAAAEFQVALWTLIYGSNVQFTPNGTMTATEIGIAQTWASNAANHIGTTRTVYALISTDSLQTFSIGVFGGPSVGNGSPLPVPLPVSAGIGFSMLCGFGSLFAMRKRLSRRPRIA